jgi:hypothetical protein
MGALKYTESLRNNLHEVTRSAGTVIYCTDTREVFYDASDDMRLLTDFILMLNNDNERTQIVNNNTVLEARIYCVRDARTFYAYDANDGWQQLLSVKEASKYVGPITDITKATIMKDGKRIAPLTTANNTYLESGETVEAKLKQMGVIATSFRTHLVTETKKRFPIPVPFDNYFDMPNAFLVHIGTNYIYPNRYSIDGNDIVFNEPVEMNRSINYTFIYNTKAPAVAGMINNIDGSLINRGSIPTDRMANVSDSPFLNSSSSVATSASVKTLFDLLVALCDEKNIISRAIAKPIATTTSALSLEVPEGYTLADGNIIAVRFRANMPANGDLVVNDRTIPVYKSVASKLEAGDITQNDELFLQYDAVHNRFYITNGMPYRMDTYNKVYTAPTDNISIISFSDASYLPGVDYMEVYLEGLKLVKDVNYRIDENAKAIHLIDFTMETGQVLELVSRRIVRTRGANSYNLNANDTAPDAPDVNPEFSSRIFSAVHDSATDLKKLRLIPPGDMDSLNDLKHGESLNIRFIDGAIGDSYTEFGQTVYNICDKNGEQIVDAITAGDIMPFIFDKTNKQFKLRFTVNSHPRIHDGNATVNPGDETVHDGNYVDIPDSPFIEYSGTDNLTYENSLFCNSRSFSTYYSTNMLSGDALERVKNAVQSISFGILNSRNGIFVRNSFVDGNKFKLYNRSDNNFVFTDNLYVNKESGFLYNNAYVSINGIPIVDKNLIYISAKQLLQLFSNKEYIELTFRRVGYSGQQFFVYNEVLHKNNPAVYADGTEIDMPYDNNRNRYISVPFLFKYYNSSPYINITSTESVTYYDKLPNTILSKEDIRLTFIPYTVLKFNNSNIYFNSSYPVELQRCRAITDTPSKEYIKLLDLFNSDNVFGRFLRNVTGFFIINGNINGQSNITIAFAYPETYGEFTRYLIQEKIL